MAIDFTKYNTTEAEIEDHLSRAKMGLFLKKGSAFLASLLSQLEFKWDESIETAQTNGLEIRFSPKFFMEIPNDTRITVLAHELWHVAREHCLPSRVMGRDPADWGEACDHVINLDLEDSSYSFVGASDCFKDSKYRNMGTEQVYDMLNKKQKPPKQQPKPQQGQGGQGNQGGQPPPPSKQPALSGDIVQTPAGKELDVMSKIVQAVQAARMSNQAGDIPGEVMLSMDQFLNPKVPWEVLLRRFFTEQSNDDYSWRRPNRRYDDEYLPSLISEDGLTTINYYLDISGSVSDADILRFNSEVAHIKKEFDPEHLNLITFDTRIKKEWHFGREEPFEKIVVTGRGGTDLNPVAAHINKNKPSVAVIFSDLYVDPMPSVGRVPVIWIVVGNPDAQVPFGQVLHIDNE